MADKRKITDSEDEYVDKKKKKKSSPKTLDELKAVIQAAHGEGSLMLGLNSVVNVESFPTNVASIDLASGCCGIPCGRIIEIFGHESSGKTTTCIHLAAACQKHYFKNKGRYGVVAFVDAEHAIDPEWATACGVDFSKVLLSQPDSGEEAFDIIETMAKSGLVDLIIVDSVSGLVPMKEVESDVGDANIGAQARLMSAGLRRLVAPASASKTTVVFINQIRQKIGVMFGDNSTTSGGMALKFYASMRCRISKGSAIKVDDVTIGFRPTLNFIKNKCAPPFTTAEYDICFGLHGRPSGIDTISSLVDIGSQLDIIQRKSSYYMFDGQAIGNGLRLASKTLNENEELHLKIRNAVYSAFAKDAPTVSTKVDCDLSDDDPDLIDELSDSILDG